MSSCTEDALLFPVLESFPLLLALPIGHLEEEVALRLGGVQHDSPVIILAICFWGEPVARCDEELRVVRIRHPRQAGEMNAHRKTCQQNSRGPPCWLDHLGKEGNKPAAAKGDEHFMRAVGTVSLLSGIFHDVMI